MPPIKSPMPCSWPARRNREDPPNRRPPPLDLDRHTAHGERCVRHPCRGVLYSGGSIVMKRIVQNCYVQIATLDLVCCVGAFIALC